MLTLLLKNLNNNFNELATVKTNSIQWIDSPMKGVQRKPLDRVGNEVARATSLVKYDAGSYFSPHVHGGGEEFLVLEGVFQDEKGDYPKLTYVRNPPQSNHKPQSENGCIIFVKLWQFEPDDQQHVVKHCSLENCSQNTKQVLFESENEVVEFYELTNLNDLLFENHTGLELFVIEGEVTVEFIGNDSLTNRTIEQLKQFDWQRQPINTSCKISLTNLESNNNEERAKIWIKRNHLINVREQLSRLEQQ